MTRSQLLASLRIASLRIAGYHADNRAFTRLLIENRISQAVAADQFAKGSSMRSAGVSCSCSACAK